MKKFLTIIILLALYSLFVTYKIYTLQNEHKKTFEKNQDSESEINRLVNKLAITMNELTEYKNQSTIKDKSTDSERSILLKNNNELNNEIQKLKHEITLNDSLQKSTLDYINASKPLTEWTSATYKNYFNIANSSHLLKKKTSTRDLINLAQEKYKNFTIQDKIYNSQCDDTEVTIYINSNSKDQKELAITNCRLNNDSYEYPLVYILNKEKIYPIVNLNNYSFMYESGKIVNVTDVNDDGNFELWLEGDVCECDDPSEKNCNCNGITVIEESEGIAFLRHH